MFDEKVQSQRTLILDCYGFLISHNIFLYQNVYAIKCGLNHRDICLNSLELF